MMAARLVATSSGMPGPGVAVCAAAAAAVMKDTPNTTATASPVFDMPEL